MTLTREEQIICHAALRLLHIDVRERTGHLAAKVERLADKLQGAINGSQDVPSWAEEETQLAIENAERRL
jgi:hypothetical protein